MILLSFLYSMKRRSNLRLRQLNNELELALSKIKTMEGLIPICSQCKKIRDDDGFGMRLRFMFENMQELTLLMVIVPNVVMRL
ncbi:MAG: hypothetical protein ACWA5R_12100 [bacterium]